MRALVVVLVLVGCAKDDDYPYRPPGGGGNTVDGDPPDAAPDTDDDAGPTADELTGRVCVIRDWGDPFDCADVPLGRAVRVRADTGEETVSGGDSTFALDVTTEVALTVGGEDGDLLRPTTSIHAAADSPVDAAAVEGALWDATLTTLLETQSAGAGVVYVVDSGGPVPGAEITFPAGAPVGARMYYDDGVGGFDPNAVATDADGAALLLDITSLGVTATAPDGRSAGALLATESLGVGVAVIWLPDR